MLTKINNYRLIILMILALFAAPTNAGWLDVKEVVANASIVTHVSSRELATVGFLESSFRPSVKSKHGTATGLMQITRPTWKHLVRTYGSKYNINMSTPATDAKANSIMAALYLKENRAIMEKRLKRKISVLELYLGHKFGPYRATRLLTARSQRTLLDFYPAAAERNRRVYYHESGEPRTIAEVKHMFDLRVQRAYRKYAPLAVMEVARLKEAEFLPYKVAATFGTADCVKKPLTFDEMLLLAKQAFVMPTTPFTITDEMYVMASNYFYYSGYSGEYPSGRKYNGYLV